MEMTEKFAAFDVTHKAYREYAEKCQKKIYEALDKLADHIAAAVSSQMAARLAHAKHGDYASLNDLRIPDDAETFTVAVPAFTQFAFLEDLPQYPEVLAKPVVSNYLNLKLSPYGLNITAMDVEHHDEIKLRLAM